ncbi:MAG: hypothetical protein CR984_06945 [Proteobacteria bacterium]|nr:MAG: hypothetical protein CR984_06945 [Pseudomonadota bacterium]
MNIEKMNRFFGRFATNVLKHKVIVLILILAVVAAFVSRIPKLHFITSFESFFVEDDAEIIIYNQFKEAFGNDKTLYALVEPKQGPMFTLENMEILKKLTADLEDSIPYLDEVTSVANAEFIEGRDNTLVVHDLMEDVPQTEAALMAVKQKLLDRPIYRNSIVSPDGEKTGILIKLLLPEGNPDYEKEVAQAVRSVFNKPAYQALDYHEVGAVLFDTEFQGNVKSQTMKFFRLSVLVIMVLLFVFLRRFYAVYVPLLVVFTSVGMTFGLLAMTTAMKVTCTIILPLIVTIGVCDAIYIISIFKKRMATASSRDEAIVQAMERCGLPCLITSITTIMGFLALSCVPIIPVREAGLFCAFGTAMCFIMSITLGIILLSFGKMTPEKAAKEKTAGDDIYSRIMQAVARFNIRHQNGILIVAVLITAGCIAAAANIVIENNFLDYMGDEFEVKQEIRYVDDTMCGSSTLELVFDTGKPNGIKNPEVLREIEKVQNFANGDPLVMTTSSVVDVIKTINQSLHNEDPAYYRIPGTLDEVAQYLLLYESSGGERLERVLSFDYARARLVLRTQSLGTSQALALYNHIQDYVADNVKTSEVVITGANALKVKVIDYILQAQITSVLLAFAMISVMMVIVFGSLRIGLIAMLPNVFPIVFVLGFIGITGRNLGMMNAMISAVVIGIAVDDTIHFFSHYRESRRQAKDAESALINALEGVGRPMFFTSVALTLGFSVVMLSNMVNVAEFGVLISLAVLISLISDFFIGSSLILKFGLFEEGGERG